MKTIDRHEYEKMISDAKVLSDHPAAGHVWLRPDGMVVKLFRIQPLHRRLLRRPYAIRFLHSARKLEKLGIQSVKVRSIEYVRDLGFHFATYPRLDGVSVRSLAGDDIKLPAAMDAFAAFMAALHNKGVYFRAMHLGNILWREDDTLSLIDVTDCQFLRRPLTETRRVRNFKPPLRYESDLKIIRTYGPARFIHYYLKTAQLSDRSQYRFFCGISRLHPEYHDIEQRVRNLQARSEIRSSVPSPPAVATDQEY